MEEHITKTKQDGFKVDPSKIAKEKEDFLRMKKRIHKDHLAEDK